MKTVLVFVLMSNTEPYPSFMRTSLETWDSRNAPGVETRFYSNPMAFKHPQLIQFPGGGDLCDIGRRNLQAFKWALDNMAWDFMARVNASCYVRKANLHAYVQSLPVSRVFRGVGVGVDSRSKPWLWGGAQYLISRDVVQEIVTNKHLWNHKEMEDVAMSHLVGDLGIPLDGLGRACSVNRRDNDWICIFYGDGEGGGFEFTNMDEMRRADNQHFIRVKQDRNPALTMSIMRQLMDLGL